MPLWHQEIHNAPSYYYSNNRITVSFSIIVHMVVERLDLNPNCNSLDVADHSNGLTQLNQTLTKTA